MPPDAISDLQTQLAHLKWRKVSNNNKIQAKIATSKSLVERDLLLALSQKKSTLKAQWRATVIEQELAKPLEIDEAKLRSLEEDSKLQETRGMRQVEVHAARTRACGHLGLSYRRSVVRAPQLRWRSLFL